jgi:hypothetical protein
VATTRYGSSKDAECKKTVPEEVEQEAVYVYSMAWAGCEKCRRVFHPPVTLLRLQQGFVLTPEAASPLFLAALGWLANANGE